MTQTTRWFVDVSIGYPSDRAISDYEVFPIRGVQRELLEPREKSFLEVVGLDVCAFEEILAVAHVGKPALTRRLLKVAVRLKQSLS
jgi:hypothetical protein